MLACGSKSEKALLIVQYLLDWTAGVHYRDEDGQTGNELRFLCKKCQAPERLSLFFCYPATLHSYFMCFQR